MSFASGVSCCSQVKGVHLGRFHMFLPNNFAKFPLVAFALHRHGNSCHATVLHVVVVGLAVPVALVKAGMALSMLAEG